MGGANSTGASREAGTSNLIGKISERDDIEFEFSEVRDAVWRNT